MTSSLIVGLGPNISKFEIQPDSKPLFEIDGNNIMKVSSFKNFGVQVGSQLQWGISTRKRVEHSKLLDLSNIHIISSEVFAKIFVPNPF